jgi:hypothetical protein
VVLFENVEKVIGMFFADVCNEEVVHGEREPDRLGGMLEDSFHLIVVVGF